MPLSETAIILGAKRSREMQEAITKLEKIAEKSDATHNGRCEVDGQQIKRILKDCANYYADTEWLRQRVSGEMEENKTILRQFFMHLCSLNPAEFSIAVRRPTVIQRMYIEWERYKKQTAT